MIPPNLGSLPPEVVFPILIDLPVQTVLRVCQVSSYLRSFCQSWDFWRDKAYHDFQVPPEVFNAFREQNPLDRYRLLAQFQKHPEQTINQVARLGDVTLMHYLLTRTPHIPITNFGLVLQRGIGHLPMVQYLVEQILPLLPDPNSNKQLFLDTGLIDAIMSGQLPVVDYLLTHGASRHLDHLNNALRKAVLYSHGPIMQYLVEHGANGLNDTLIIASQRQNNLPIVQYLVEHGATNLDAALQEASRRGVLQTVDYLVSQGATDLNEALENAAREGHLDVVKFLVAHGATELRYPMNLLRSLYASNEYQREQWNQISDYLEAEIRRRRESRRRRPRTQRVPSQ
jgi:phosphohistidine phosphatase SixA